MSAQANPADPRFPDRVDKAEVLKQGIVAATLERTPEGTVFRYLDDYLERGLPSVATTLPASDEPTTTRHGAVPAYFAGLLPEGRRLTGLRRAIKASADDDLTLLLAVGRDPVGDVQVVPVGERPGAAASLVQVERSFDEVTFADILGEAGVIDPVALAGVQDKASARMISVPLAKAGHRYILKVDPPEFPRVVENEAYFIRLARAARYPVVSAQVVHDAVGRSGLLVERFDRVMDSGGHPRSLAVEDGTQAMGLYPADKYSVTAEGVVSALANLCAAKPVALRDLFRQLCFAWLTGNGDVHAKNLSVLATATREWRVAPAYDLPSTLPYRDYSMALAMGGRRDGLSRRTLIAFGTDLGLPVAAAHRVLDSVLTATDRVAEDLSDGVLPFPPEQVRAWTRSLRNRRRLALD